MTKNKRREKEEKEEKRRKDGDERDLKEDDSSEGAGVDSREKFKVCRLIAKAKITA